MTNLVHLSDPHFTDSPRTLDSGYLIDDQNSRVKSALLAGYLVANKSKLNASTVVITGDLTDSGDPGDYAIARDFIERLRLAGYTVVAVPGNHDYCFEGALRAKGQADVLQRREWFRQYIDARHYPSVVECDFGVLVLLDSMEGELEDWPRADHWAQGCLGAAQLETLRAIVTTLQAERGSGKRVFVCLHHHPLHLPKDDARGGLRDAGALLELLKDRVDGLLFGHATPAGLLRQSFPKEEGDWGIPIINCENLEHGPWSAETDLGEHAVRLAVTTTDDQRLVLSYVGMDGGTYCREQAGDGSWSPELDLGGNSLQLCAERSQDGVVEVFTLGADGHVLHALRPVSGAWGRLEALGTWAGEEALEGIPDTTQLLCAGRDVAGGLDLFYAGRDLQIMHVRRPQGGAWSEAEALEGSATHLSLCQDREGRSTLFSIGTNWGIYQHQQSAPGGPWSRSRVGGWAAHLGATVNAQGMPEIFYVGRDGKIRHDAQRSAGVWEGETTLGGAAEQVVATNNRSGRIEIVYVGTDGRLFHNWQLPSGAWAGEESIRGYEARGRQVCVGKSADGRLQVFYRGRTNFSTYHLWQTEPDESYPITLIEPSTRSRQVLLAPGA